MALDKKFFSDLFFAGIPLAPTAIPAVFKES